MFRFPSAVPPVQGKGSSVPLESWQGGRRLFPLEMLCACPCARKGQIIWIMWNLLGCDRGNSAFGAAFLVIFGWGFLVVVWLGFFVVFFFNIFFFKFLWVF